MRRGEVRLPNTVANTKEVTMVRIVAVLLAVLVDGCAWRRRALAQMPKSDSAQPKSMEMKRRQAGRGTITSAQGSTVTLDDRTMLSIPSSGQGLPGPAEARRDDRRRATRARRSEGRNVRANRGIEAAPSREDLTMKKALSAVFRARATRRRRGRLVPTPTRPGRSGRTGTASSRPRPPRRPTCGRHARERSERQRSPLPAPLMRRGRRPRRRPPGEVTAR